MTRRSASLSARLISSCSGHPAGREPARSLKPWRFFLIVNRQARNAPQSSEFQVELPLQGRCPDCYKPPPMRATIPQRVLAMIMVTVFLASQVWATCGGGGGGGMGGMSGGSQQVYTVPWKLIKPGDAVKEGLIVYWFPMSDMEFQKSSLRESRILQLYSEQCVTMGVVDARNAVGQKYVPDGRVPTAVIAQASDGVAVGRLENKDGKLRVGDLEKLVESEMKKRES